MGFQNLQTFNLPLLSKQGWRILSNPDSLVARIYKAKYFPHGDVLNSKKGNNPSYAWRSIHNSLEIIRKGTRWKVGNGKRIHIWDDRWLPTPSTHKVISPPKPFDNFPMVSSLIDESTKWWKPKLVKSLFLPFEATTILRIPISYSLLEDNLIWIRNKSGTFTVKSAYYIATKVVEQNGGRASTNSHSASPFWKKIWQLKVLQKSKFLPGVHA
ncbi:uncharacterized protein LOC136065853 [Quercus suber]|uniref:uncharacterized protein LOC136065853 n=1 Tax=Quercus suber TaxID=58331 RepID=UPI0032DFA0C5